MAWQNELVLILRHLINDWDQPYTFTDIRLEQTIIMAALFVNAEIDFSTTYTIDVDSCVLSPDPTVSANRDEDFMVLITLKSACFIDQSSARTAAATHGVRIREGRSEIDTRRQIDSHRLILSEMACKLYEEAKMQRQFGKPLGIKAILTPFSGPDVISIAGDTGDFFS